MPETLRIARYPTAERALHAAADLITALAPRSLTLAGGSTPADLYSLLASDDYRSRIDWPEIDVYFGDERAVPPDHADSNYGMAKRTLLDLVPLAEDAVHRLEGEDEDLDAAANRYALALPARLDVVLLGMGGDGHTASLFPGRKALEERERRCVATRGADNSKRLTLTYPALNTARHVIFLALGASKRDALARIRAGESPPAARVQPTDGGVTWIVDDAAFGDD